jgi:hypothetical protein
MKCGTVYSSKIDVCERCHSNLVVVHNASSVQYEGGSGNGILCVVSLLFPLIGFILGLIYIAKDDGDQGKMFMFLGVISCVITAIMLALIVN